MKETEWWAEEEFAPDPIYTECATEYTLPDYLPDVRRVLTVRGRLMPSGQFLGNGKAEFAGSCLFSVLYCDPEGKVASLSVPLDYHYGVNMGVDDTAQVKLFEDSRLENVSCRLIGPRKMQLRGMVASRPKWWTATEKEALPLEEEGVQMLEKECMARQMFPFSTEERSMTMTTPVSEGGDLQLLFYDGAVFVREITQGREGTLAKGEVKLEAVCAGEDGVPFSLSLKTPFEEMLPEEATPHSFCTGKITSLEGNISEEGEGSQLIFDVGIRLFGHTAEHHSQTIFTDVFSTECPLEVQYGQETVWHHVGEAVRYFTLDGSVERQDAELGQAMTVASTSLSTDGLTFTADGNRLVVTTNAHVTMLLSSGMGEEGPSLQNYSFDYPLKMELTLGETPPKDTKWEGVLTLAPAHGRLDQNKLFFDTEACLSVWGSQKETYQVVEDVAFDHDHPFPKEGHQIIATYLKDGDSLWDIAKRYHTSPEQIAQQNGLAEEAMENPDQAYTLDGYIRLLITT